MNHDTHFLTPKSIADRLGRCRKTVLTMIRRGDFGPIHRLNQRVILVPRASFEDFLNRTRVDPQN